MRHHKSRMWTTFAGLVTIAGVVLGTAGCSSGAGTGTGGSTTGTGTLDGNGKTIVAFLPSTSNIFVRDWLTALEDEAGRYHYKLKSIQNNFDQTEEDQQVQQYISSGETPAAFIWWPSDAKSGVNSARQLLRIAPVIQTDQNVVAGAEDSITAYAGPDTGLVGTLSGEAALKARDADRKAGRKLHSPGGNLIEFSFTTGYQAGVDRHNAFMKATAADPFTLLTNEPVSSLDAQGGFEAASQIIPKFKSQGIDYIFCQNNDLCVGVLKALQQNGLEPNKDVVIFPGNLSGDTTAWQQGLFQTGIIQSPVIGAWMAMDAAAQYLASGKVTDTTVSLDASVERPEVKVGPLPLTTIQPFAPITPAEKDTFQLWGLKFGQFGAGS